MMGRLLSTIKDWDLLYQTFLCCFCKIIVLSRNLLIKMNFTLAVAPPFVHPMASLLATPTHSVWKYGFSKPTWRRQVAKYGHLKHCESLYFLVTERA